ncbi:MAG: lipopolysaccharide biosynthesis protein [Gemmatimonadetes bacterium]|nr:lipopolysaccharide biosynthesis protein [Gemmatimonadota bacterium]
MAAERPAGSRARFQPSPFLRDILNTVAATGILMVSLVLTTRWVAEAFSSADFGVYGLARRLVGTLSIYSNVAGLTLVRFLAIAEDDRAREGHLLGATVLSLGPGLVLFGAGLLLPEVAARLAFDDATRRGAAVAMLGLVVTTALFNLLYAYYRGTGRVALGNVWNIALVGVGPMLVVLAWAGTGRIDVMIGGAALVLLLAAVPLAGPVLRGWGGAARRDLPQRLREQLAFGLPRVPGGLAIGGLTAVGPYLAIRFATAAEAGYLVAGQLLLRLVDAGTAAFGVVALPRIAELHAQGQREFIRDRVEDVVALAFHLGAFATLHLLVWSDVIVRAWLGDRYIPAIPLVRIVLVSAVPYCGYTLLRSVIDVLDERAINTRNTVTAAGVTLALSLGAGVLGYGAVGLAVATTGGLMVLGALSVHFLWVTLQPRGDALLLGRGAVLAAGTGVAGFGLRQLLPAGWPIQGQLGLGLLITGALGGLFVLGLRQSGARWVAECESRVVRRRAGRAA